MEIILSAVYIFSAKGTVEAGELANCFSGLQDMSSISETNLQKKKKKAWHIGICLYRSTG